MNRFDASLQILKAILSEVDLEDRQPGEKISIIIEQLQRIYIRIAQIEDNSKFFDDSNHAEIEHSKVHRKRLFQILEVVQIPERNRDSNLETKLNNLLNTYALLCAQFLVDRQMRNEQIEQSSLSDIHSPEQFNEIITNPKRFKPSDDPDLPKMLCDDPDC